MFTDYTFYEIEMYVTVRGKHCQARRTEGIPNAEFIIITFIKSTGLSIKIDGHSFIKISSGKTVST